MSVVLKRIAVSIIFGLSLAAGAAELPVHVGPDHDAIRTVGRFTDDYRFGWTGCRIEMETDAQTVDAELQSVAGGPAGMTVVVDGEARFLKVVPGQTVYRLAEGLPPGRHRIELFKRSEGQRGCVQFNGFALSEGAQLFEVEASERRILVVGDSITCGYGNEAASIEEGNTIENENGYMSYAAIAARRLDADLMMVCWSGRGMYRNRQKNNDTAETMPVVFDRTLPLSAEPEWDHRRYVPDVTVINLGTNDQSTHGGKNPLQKSDYIGAYKKFIRKIRSFAPDSHVIVSIGPMAYGELGNWLEEIAGELEDVSVLVYARPQGQGDVGGHWHPSVAKHKKMADELVEKIKTVMRR